MESLKNCNAVYHLHATGKIYRYTLGFAVTSGALIVADECSCHWFYGVIISAQCEKKVSCEPFQAWILKRVDDCEFIVLGTNGNYVDEPEEFGMTEEENNANIIYSQKILFSDFEYDQLKVWLSENVIYLPSEH